MSAQREKNSDNYVLSDNFAPAARCGRDARAPRKERSVSPGKFFLLQVAASCLAANLQTQTAAAETAAAIQTIRQQYAAINKRASRYRKVKKELSGFSLEGSARNSPDIVPPPLIIKLPFALKSEYSFTEWLVDCLPR